MCIKRAKIAHAFDEVKRNETNHQTLGNRIAHWLPVDLAVWQSLSGRKNRLRFTAARSAVRDALLASSETLFGSSQPESREALETTAKAHLHEMETIAQQVVQEQGYSYPVKAELVTMPFTERTYEDLTMPAGTYEAIRITIGAAAGQNWWCVMYPPLCIPVAEDVAVQDEQAKAYFSDAEQDVLYHPERYRVKWKLAEWFKKWTTSEQTDHTTSHISDLRTFF